MGEGLKLLVGISLLISLSNGAEKPDQELLLLTVATNNTDGFQRYLRSTQIYDLNGKVLGMGEKWEGGDMNFPGGGFKVNLLKKELEEYKEKEDLIILFTDSYDVIIAGEADEIVEKFKSFDAKIVFGAEDFCWPKTELKNQYPAIEKGQRFLNSGGFIGFAKNLYEMVNHKVVENLDDDQLYYSEIFVDPELREKYGMKLDHHSKIFQNLNGAVGDVELQFKESIPFLHNNKYESTPLVIHGNGPSKKILNSLGNYLALAWNQGDQCTSCWEDNLEFKALLEVPQVVLGIFITRPTPFLEEFFTKIFAMDYPRNKIDLFIYNSAEYHIKHVEQFKQLLSTEKPEDQYHSIEVWTPEQNKKEWHAREHGIQKCLDVKCDYFFSVDGDAHLDNVNVLKLLIEQNRKVIAPLLVRPFKAWSNFWGALTPEGFYARSTDYMDIVQNSRRGLWNVPFISSCYLIQGALIENKYTRPTFINKLMDPDMAFCQSLREKDIFFYVSNRLDWGHLINSDDFETTHMHNELWEIANNQLDWETRYLHPNYSQSLEEDAEVEQPCPDVFWFPIVTERFADELIEEMENYGDWSDGSNTDPRLKGGYESVPTRDIHMKQIGYDQEWLHFLDFYVRPLQESVFTGYLHSDQRIEGGYEAVPTRDIHMRQIGMDDQWLEFLRLYVKPLVESQFIGYNSDPPRSIMNFVVRYRPDEQPSLRPHHDASTYTINIALNNAGTDYSGGGCRFIRYDCSIPGTKKGWMLMHPGRLTHYHEGLETTNGTRYIMISFIDP
ncbi:multifunctional procollagen lysine hydroxylase and glycosyltransferase LH3-like isoform X1 [Tigriopus californicus]|uniref:multifunctional procollagen lysine hydroxylase and glycosyltransferase LH3-like isoform X1 n=1 Tax=Tigriopus californicus TaxID=6832 RepID=UPI0027DA63F2|nr:multifunctional procollagen lysine hydroxylase and glycosyltransferase LH3-like isoform X1 [Tigriopus californicus]